MLGSDGTLRDVAAVRGERVADQFPVSSAGKTLSPRLLERPSARRSVPLCSRTASCLGWSRRC